MESSYSILTYENCKLIATNEIINNNQLDIEKNDYVKISICFYDSEKDIDLIEHIWIKVKSCNNKNEINGIVSNYLHYKKYDINNIFDLNNIILFHKNNIKELKRYTNYMRVSTEISVQNQLISILNNLQGNTFPSFSL